MKTILNHGHTVVKGLYVSVPALYGRHGAQTLRHQTITLLSFPPCMQLLSITLTHNFSTYCFFRQSGQTLNVLVLPENSIHSKKQPVEISVFTVMHLLCCGIYVWKCSNILCQSNVSECVCQCKTNIRLFCDFHLCGRACLCCLMNQQLAFCRCNNTQLTFQWSMSHPDCSQSSGVNHSSLYINVTPEKA